MVEVTFVDGPVARSRSGGELPSLRGEEGRRFLAARLRLFHVVVLALGTLFFLLVNGARLIEEERAFAAWFWGPCNLLNFLQVAVNLAAIAATTALTFGPRALRSIDLAGTALLSWICAAYGFAEDFIPAQDYHAILVVTNLLVLRAFVVPGRWTHALGLALVATPACVLPQLLASGPGHLLMVTVFLCWAIIAIILSVFAARTIHGLQEEVREARRLGQYTLEEKIGQGGMGTVYRASHALLRRPTAVKILAGAEVSPLDAQRFEREVQLTSQLTHPNTIAIYDYGRTEDGVFYYAMEYLPGLDLRRLVRDHGPQPPGRVVHLVAQICASLAEAHDHGLVHRDIKPANIILTTRGGVPDTVKVLDFGLVKTQLDEDLKLTQPRALLGTPRYLAPEAIRNSEKADHRSDLYAVAATAYWLLAGCHVFEAPSLAELCAQHVSETPQRPSLRLGRELPADLEELVLQGLEKDPLRRPESAAEFRRRLLACSAAGTWSLEEARAWWDEQAPSVATEIFEDGSAIRGRIPETVEDGLTIRVQRS